MRHSFAPVAHNPPVLAAAVAGMGSLHRDWCLRVARELALDFGRCGGAEMCRERMGREPFLYPCVDLRLPVMLNGAVRSYKQSML